MIIYCNFFSICSLGLHLWYGYDFRNGAERNNDILSLGAMSVRISEDGRPTRRPITMYL